MCNLSVLGTHLAKVLFEGTKESRFQGSQLAVPRKQGKGGLWMGSPRNAAWK